MSIRITRTKLSGEILQRARIVALSAAASMFTLGPVIAQADVVTTPAAIPELPIEVETEVGPAGSLKGAPLWKETVELLEDPYANECLDDDPATTLFDESIHCVATTERRSFFDPVTGEEVDTMPALNTFDPCHNVLTAQPLRYRPDGEIDWNQPGALFDPEEIVSVVDPIAPYFLISNIPAERRTMIGALVACPSEGRDAFSRMNARYACDNNSAEFDGTLVVNNPDDRRARRTFGFSGRGTDDRIPPHQTIIATPACSASGVLLDEDGAPLDELEQPVNENHFFAEEDPADDYTGRHAAETLGKALFWDMQVGSDGVQSCGTCHFQAGIDVRTRNQLNPNTNGGDLTLDVRGQGGATIQDTNAIDIGTDDFPFHDRGGAAPGDGGPLLGTDADSNDVMASMGVAAFRFFHDVRVGAGAFGAPDAATGVAALLPDISRDDSVAEGGLGEPPEPDPIPVMQGNRRIEPRNTPTMHAAAFNFDNFWDGRARHDFNGGSVFGPSDPFFHVYVDCDGGELEGLVAPIEAEEGPLCEWNEEVADAGEDAIPVRIRFSSLASQAVGPPLSDFEMSFAERNWQKIGKKMLQDGVVPLANQLVDVDDSRLGSYSNQGGSECTGGTAVGKPGLCISYPELIERAFREDLWINDTMHLAGTKVPMNNDCAPGEQIHELGIPATCDPFDGYVLAIEDDAADGTDTDQFTQKEANFSLFFALAVQAYEQLLIPDHTPWDQFNDIYGMLGNGVAQPGEQGTLPPGVIRELVTGSATGFLDVDMVDGIDEDVLFGFDLFAGGNLTAALPEGSDRNPEGFGSNPFLRTGRCMLCHLGPEQSDHTNNVNAGLLQSGTEIEYPTPPSSPEPTGVLRLVTGISLAEELEENAQDGVEVENRNFILFPLGGLEAQDGVPMPATANNAVVAPVNGIAFQDNGIYNVGLRPTQEDIMRGGDDPFGYPLSLAALALKNLGGEDFEPCDGTELTADDPSSCTPGSELPNFDASMGAGGGLYDTVGEGFPFDGTSYEQDSINPGLELEPSEPMLPEYLAEWANNLPAGELSPQIDELAFAPNTITHAPVAEYGEILFGADAHCGVYDPARFGAGPPNFGWGPQDSSGIGSTRRACPNSQTGVAVNMGLGLNQGQADPDVYVPGSLVAPPNGTWPWPNRVARNGASKVPQLRNVELTGPYFHTGSYLTLRSVVDFYFRGGDFPLTNVIDRDPNLVDVEVQAFGFGATTGLDPIFLDGIPDATSQYDAYPDTDHDETPEPGAPGGGDPMEDVKDSIVKFLLALTDERVAHRSAPFDQPEIFVPIDGVAPAITGGRDELIALSSAPCAGGVEAECFKQVPGTGRTGQTERLKPFLEIGSEKTAGVVDHFDP